ncbi:MAG: BatA domain-containing protein [Deltaproteobacteria bacterium]|nr:BatA domain-containing protein [Deltaproteobacteria bacterium]
MNSWSFVHPWLLLGLLGVSLPILIHLIGKRRAPTIFFAAFDFLLAVNKRLARRERLRQILLLLARSLALAALALAVARPTPHVKAAVGTLNRRLAVVVDTSASMAYVDGGVTLLSRAKDKARELMTHLEPGDRVLLAFAGARLEIPFAQPTSAAAALKAAIDSIDAPAGVADIGAAIDALLALYGAEAAGATLVVISDLAQNSFAHLRPTALEPPPEVRLIDAALRSEPRPLDNLALEKVTVEEGAHGAAERRFKVEVHNYGGTDVRDRSLELAIDLRVTLRGYIDVPARATAEKVLSQAFDGPGIYSGTIRLSAPDGYAQDDQLGFLTAVSPGVKVLAVDGDPRTTPYEDELFFLQHALEVIPQGDPPLPLRLASVDELAHGGEDLAFTAFDVVVLANVARLGKGLVEELGRFVRDGGGLVVTGGDRMQFEAVNEELGELLPHPLRDRQRAADPDAGTPPLGIGEIDLDHPIFQGLGAAATESLRASRTATYFNLDVGAGVRARTLLRFENGAPALVERSVGKGRVLLLSTSVDVDWSDLGLRSVFPALLQRLARYAGGAIEAEAQGEARAGDSVDIPLPTGARAVALISPRGVRREVAVADASGRRARFAALSEVGLYRAEVLTGEWTPAPRLAVVVNQSLSESDFTPVAASQIAEALGGDKSGRDVLVRLGAATGGDPFESRGQFSYLLLALGLLFVTESLLASFG